MPMVVSMQRRRRLMVSFVEAGSVDGRSVQESVGRAAVGCLLVLRHCVGH
jgi:hypothetical protein